MRPVGSVITERASELLALDGVVGVYEGTRPDGSQCIRVAVAGRTPEITGRIPAQIEGYPVEIVETGPIRPLT